jgi:hypothetical protein
MINIEWICSLAGVLVSSLAGLSGVSTLMKLHSHKSQLGRLSGLL